MERLEIDPCLLVRHIPATSHHAAAALAFKRPCASRRDTRHDERARRRRAPRAPPCPLPTRSPRGTGRAIANEPGFVSRVFVVACRRWCVWVSTERPNAASAPSVGIIARALRVVAHAVRDLPWADRLCPAQNVQVAMRATTGKLRLCDLVLQYDNARSDSARMKKHKATSRLPSPGYPIT